MRLYVSEVNSSNQGCRRTVSMERRSSSLLAAATIASRVLFLVFEVEFPYSTTLFLSQQLNRSVCGVQVGGRTVLATTRARLVLRNLNQ